MAYSGRTGQTSNTIRVNFNVLHECTHFRKKLDKQIKNV